MDGIALLNGWLTEAGMTPSQFARALGASRAIVSQWRSGVRSPSRHYALEIERITRSRVPASSWDREPAAKGH